MTQLPKDEDVPFSEPADSVKSMPVDYPSLNGNVDLHEAYDEGIESTVDYDPYSIDDNPSSIKKILNKGAASPELFTTDHEKIRGWAEYRYGHPAKMLDADNDMQKGGLYIYFEDNPPDLNIEPISWHKFFKLFDKYHLAFLFRTRNLSGNESHFYKFFDRRYIDLLTGARKG